MRPKEIKKLIEYVEQSNINELEVSRWGRKVRIIKYSKDPSVTTHAEVITVPSPPPVQPSPSTVPPAAPIPEPAPPKIEPREPASKLMEVKSPMVGTFYRSPAPDADPYIQLGDIVSTNQVLCIIEAMKLMNEIESEVRGRIVEILVENAQPVEYNQVLFRIEKL